MPIPNCSTSANTAALLVAILGACQETPATRQRRTPTANQQVSVASAPEPTKKAQPTASERPLRCPKSMVLLGGQAFDMGSPAEVGEADERPVRRVELPPFCLARTETTVTDYQRCVASGRCTPAGNKKADNCNAGYPDRSAHPINCINWSQAASLCAASGGRLPSEAEWELAARGGDGRIYPWGNEPPDRNLLNVCGAECARIHRGWPAMHQGDDGWPKTAPVGHFPAGRSEAGLLDLAGNVWEWTADRHLPYPGAAASSVPAVLHKQRVVRGGGWFHNKPTELGHRFEFDSDAVLPLRRGLR